MEWIDFSAGDFYFPHEPRVIVALADRHERLGLPPPYEDEERWFLDSRMAKVYFRRISLRRPVHLGEVPPLSGEGRPRRRFDATFIPLFPTASEELSEVARAWTAVLEAPEPPGVREGHRFFLASQVADDYTALPGLLENERVLWEAIRRLHPGRDEVYQQRRLDEALDIGRSVIERFLAGGRQPYGVAMNVLEDLVRREMVTNKLMALRAYLPRDATG